MVLGAGAELTVTVIVDGVPTQPFKVSVTWMATVPVAAGNFNSAKKFAVLVPPPPNT